MQGFLPRGKKVINLISRKLCKKMTAPWLSAAEHHGGQNAIT